MPKIQFVRADATPAGNWEQVYNFSCEGRVVSLDGREVEVVSKYKRDFSRGEKVWRRVLGWMASIFSGSIAYHKSKTIRDYVNKDYENVRFCVLKVPSENDSSYFSKHLGKIYHIKSTAAINKRDSNGRTQLHRAILNKAGLKEIQGLLKTSQLDVNIRDRDGNTALHLAISNSDNSDETSLIIFNLLHANSNPNIKNRMGMAVIHLINERNYKALIPLAPFVDPAVENGEGENAFHILSKLNIYETRDIEMIEAFFRILLDKSTYEFDSAAILKKPNKAGKTPFQIAYEEAKKEIANNCSLYTEEDKRLLENPPKDAFALREPAKRIPNINKLKIFLES